MERHLYLIKKFYTIVSCFVLTGFAYTLQSQGTISGLMRVDQIGYLPGAQKIAILTDPIIGFNAAQSYTPANTIELRKSTDATVIATFSPTPWNNGVLHEQSGDKVWLLDFSAVNSPGDYYLYDATNNLRSYTFSIQNGVYRDILKQACRMFYYQRSGTPKPDAYAGVWNDGAAFTHPEQDLDCRLVTDPVAGTSMNLSGGWFDAGDFNKYVNFTYSTLHNLLGAFEQNPSAFTDDYNIPESGNGIPDLLDEIKWELEWIRKMQQADGSVLMKVSVTDFSASSPPSADINKRRYGAAANSAARTMSSVLAHAAIVYRSTNLPALVNYGDTLLMLAERSWQFLEDNPAISQYNNAGFQSANPEMDEYSQKAAQTCAAAYLFAATGNTAYRDYFDARYLSVHAMEWYFWYPFESTFQDALLYYAHLPNGTASVKNTIIQRCIGSVRDGSDNLAAFNAQTDAYRAFLKSDNYVWGSNSVKSAQGSMLYNMKYYGIDADNQENYTNAAAGYLHYLHGVNPNGLMYLTNMGSYGAENSAQQMYHNWLGNGTAWDNNPAPGYLTGGVNKYFTPAQGTIAPPQNQPVQKSYKDWNTSWPENSWEITEPAIYYQAAYIKLLSKFVSVATNSTHTPDYATSHNFSLSPNPAQQVLNITFGTALKRQIQVFNSEGKLILQHNSSTENTTLNIANFSPGTYNIVVANTSKKFIKY
jgi:endoglucanase